MVPGDKIPNPWPSLSTGLQAAEKRFRRHTTKTKRLAEEVEVVFHEAAHAVITNELGGDFAQLEIHRTLKERRANEHAWGSISMRFENDPWGEAIASLAGPIAGRKLTGILRKGWDYGDAIHSLNQTVGTLDDAEAAAEALVDKLWHKIVRIATLLMITEFGKPPARTYAYWHLRKHLCEIGCTSTVADTLAAIPDTVKNLWEAERREADKEHSHPA